MTSRSAGTGQVPPRTRPVVRGRQGRAGLLTVPQQLMFGRRAAEAVWVGLPRRVGVVSQTMASLLRDGRWLSAVPVVGLLMPVAAIIVGFRLAVHQPEPLWTYTYGPAVVMAAAGALGTAIGLWASLGYVVGLLFYWQSRDGQPLSKTGLPASSYRDLREQGHGVFNAFGHTYLGLLITMLVLVEVAVLTPAVALGCRSLLSRLLVKQPLVRTIVEGVVSTALIVFLTWQWTQAVQYAIRPYWTFQNGYPDTAAFDPLRDHARVVWMVAGGVSAARWLITAALPAPAPLKRRGKLRSLHVWWPISVVFQTVVVTLFAAGVLDSVGQGLVFAAVVAGGLILRKLILPRIPGVAKVVNAIPMLIRLAAIFGIGYWVSQSRVGAAYDSGTNSLVSFAQTVGITIAVAALLLVSRTPEPWLPASWTAKNRPRSRSSPAAGPPPAGPPAAGPPPAGPPPGGPWPTGPPGGPAGPRNASSEPTTQPIPAVETPPSASLRLRGPGPGMRRNSPSRGRPSFGVRGFLGTVTRWSSTVATLTLVAGMMLAGAGTAAADNCSGLSDCSTAAKVGIAAAIALALLALAIFALPALLAAGAAEGAAAAVAADEAIAAYAAADAASVAASAAADAAASSAAAIAEAAADGLIGEEAAAAAAEAAAEANAAAWEAATAANEAQAAAQAALEASQVGDLAAAEAASAEAEAAAAQAEAAALDAEGASIEADIAGVNPAGATDNCGYVAQAIDERLAGDAAVYADANGVSSTQGLADAYGSTWEATSEQGISDALQASGDGSRGIVTVQWEGSEIGHTFNVVERGGTTFFVDGQTGQVATSIGDLFPGSNIAGTWWFPTFP